MCFGSWNKINPFITKYSPNQQFWNTLITMSEIPYPHYNLWNNQADIVILSFNNELVLLVHWWQRQAAVERPLRGDERAPDTAPAKPCAQPSDELPPPPTDELPPPPMDELPPPLPPPLADDLLMPPRDLPPPAPEVTSVTPADGAPEDSTPLAEDVAPVVRDDKSDALGDHPPPPSADDLFEGRGAPGYLPPPPPPAAPAPAAKESVKPDISKSPPPAPQHPLSSGALRMQARWLDLQLEQLQRQCHDVMEAAFYAMKMDFQRLERENEALRHRTAYLEAELRGYERNADYVPDPHLVGQLQRVCSCRSHLLVPSTGRTAVYSMDTRDLALLDVSTQSEELSCDPL